MPLISRSNRPSAQACLAFCWDSSPNSSTSSRVMPRRLAIRSAASNWLGSVDIPGLRRIAAWSGPALAPAHAAHRLDAARDADIDGTAGDQTGDQMVSLPAAAALQSTVVAPHVRDVLQADNPAGSNVKALDAHESALAPADRLVLSSFILLRPTHASILVSSATAGPVARGRSSDELSYVVQMMRFAIVRDATAFTTRPYLCRDVPSRLPPSVAHLICIARNAMVWWSWTDCRRGQLTCGAPLVAL